MSNVTGTASPVLLEPVDAWYWVIRGIIAILTIIGNGLVIYMIAFKRRLRVPNNWFVLSLAVVDFCVGLFTTASGLLCTFQLRCDWRLQTTFYNFLLFASTLNLWAMAIDRYIGIVYSLRYKSLVTTKRVVAMVAMSWGISFVAAFVRLLWLQNNHFNQRIDKYYRVVIDLFFGIISCAVLVTIYFRILFISRKLARNAARQLGQINYNYAPYSKKTEARGNKSAKFLGLVVLLFVLCYSLSIYISFCLIFKLNSAINALMMRVSLLLVHFNSAVNFVVYAFMKKDIRLEFRRLCRCRRDNPSDFTESREFSLA